LTGWAQRNLLLWRSFFFTATLWLFEIARVLVRLDHVAKKAT